MTDQPDFVLADVDRKPPVEVVLALFDVDVEVGIIRWRARDPVNRHVKSWNSKNAGNIVYNLNGQGHNQVHPIIDGIIYHLMVHHIIFAAVNNRWPVNQIDHLNGLRHDNRFCNLREASGNQNACNRLFNLNNSSGYKGVSWYPKLSKWQSKIGYKGKLIHIGYFEEAHDAALSYDEAALRIHGKFAKTNAMLGRL